MAMHEIYTLKGAHEQFIRPANTEVHMIPMMARLYAPVWGYVLDFGVDLTGYTNH